MPLYRLALLVQSTTTAPQDAGDESLHNAWILFGAIAALLVLFVLLIALLTFHRWLRQRRTFRTPAPREPSVDPWAEAGRRAKPFRKQ